MRSADAVAKAGQLKMEYVSRASLKGYNVENLTTSSSDPEKELQNDYSRTAHPGLAGQDRTLALSSGAAAGLAAI